ncbi:hypothetical protein M5K25_000492 [Dendrobium thyrsiflorum]|uniref:Uncharacterized protein n=1 Tax=Dendrobium thyrsiflorum TaxID=117978 RepID=A0ABD0VUE0_DENTH
MTADDRRPSTGVGTRFDRRSGSGGSVFHQHSFFNNSPPVFGGDASKILAKSSSNGVRISSNFSKPLTINEGGLLMDKSIPVPGKGKNVVVCEGKPNKMEVHKFQNFCTGASSASNSKEVEAVGDLWEPVGMLWISLVLILLVLTKLLGIWTWFDNASLEKEIHLLEGAEETNLKESTGNVVSNVWHKKNHRRITDLDFENCISEDGEDGVSVKLCEKNVEENIKKL